MEQNKPLPLSKSGIFLSILLTFFSTFVLAYISMATMLGPWIAPTLVLLASLCFRFKKQYSSDEKNREIALIQTAGSLGGIIATAVGFTIPTLFFLDKAQFSTLLASPISFSFLIGSTCLAGGSLGIIIGKALKGKFLHNKSLPHPYSHLIHKTITAQEQGKQSKQLLAGFSLSWAFCFVRDKLLTCKEFFVFPSLLGQGVPIVIMPMLWAIGFIAGAKIIFPLLVGMLSKYLVILPINNHSLYLPIKLFPVYEQEIFGMAFCSGLILAEILPGLLKYPGIIVNQIKNYSGYSYINKVSHYKNHLKALVSWKGKDLEGIFSLIAIALVLLFLHFSLLSLFIIIPLTIIAAYNVSTIGCKIGLVQIGRFTTFVMIPMLLFFPMTPLQVTFLCVLVASCITTTSDVLFGYKIGSLCSVEEKQTHRLQWLGLIVTALCIGFFLWLLFTNLEIGSTELFAQRGKARALLIQSFTFDWIIVIIGLLFGLLLQRLKISPSMVLGGILMPNGLTIGLVFGAIGAFIIKKRQEYFPFFSGLSAGESIWFLLSLLLQKL